MQGGGTAGAVEKGGEAGAVQGAGVGAPEPSEPGSKAQGQPGTQAAQGKGEGGAAASRPPTTDTRPCMLQAFFYQQALAPPDGWAELSPVDGGASPHNTCSAVTGQLPSNLVCCPGAGPRFMGCEVEVQAAHALLARHFPGD